MKSNILKIRLRGAEADSEHVRLQEFIKQLEAVRIALKHTEHLVSDDGKSPINYLITDLTHSSPATVSIEAFDEFDTDKPSAVISKFIGGIREILFERRAPADFDRQTLEAYKGLTSGLRKHVSEFTIIDGESEVLVPRELEHVIDTVIGPDILSEGVVKGGLEAVNVHSKQSFVIYPDIGPNRVECNFKKSLFDLVKSALRQHVIVSGTMKYKSMDPFPYAMDVKNIEVCPPDDELPSLWDLRGIARDAFGGSGSVEYVRAVRDADV